MQNTSATNYFDEHQLSAAPIPSAHIKESLRGTYSEIKDRYMRIVRFFPMMVMTTFIWSLLLVTVAYASFLAGFVYHAYYINSSNEDATKEVVALNALAEQRESAAKKICGKDVGYYWTPDSHLVCASSSGKVNKVTLFDAKTIDTAAEVPLLDKFSPQNMTKMLASAASLVKPNR